LLNGKRGALLTAAMLRNAKFPETLVAPGAPAYGKLLAL
jgi:hypothetical protein